jgi:diguanylate cyclase (GGDEF)-like protein
MSTSSNGGRFKRAKTPDGEHARADAELMDLGEEPVFTASRADHPNASEVDQTAADSDQTASDGDQTASDFDQAQSDSDQDSSDSDQAASDRDQLASEHESGGAADGRVREQARSDRLRSTRARGRRASDRARAAESRETGADERDRSAFERDRAALLRDAAAEMLDEVTRYGDEIELELERKRAGDRARAASDRAKAAEDRQRAAGDRVRASADRADAVRERAKAGRERAQAALDLETSETDELTRVRRRGAGVQQLQREMDRARRVDERLVVAFIDVDGLKAVNDAGGHAAGDALLVAVADALRACLRSYDLIVRVGGDEFICVLPKTELSTVRERFADVSAALACGATEGSITVGLAELNKDDFPADLIARADADLLAQRQKV